MALISFNSVKRNADAFYILRSKQALKQCNKKAYYDALVLKGPMILINNGENLLYLGSPYVKNAKELRRSQLYLSDMALNDMTRELIMLNQSSFCQIFVK
uniref:guanylate cyclase n=1 Tax=Acrobeloides nanus TaxID=290746 RepID=A0A914DSI5_9BILA